jgi:hypothetical protein
MNEPIRFSLKDEDAPDPQQTGLDLMEQLRALAADAVYLRGLLTRVGADPITTHSKAAHQAVDLAATANRALDAGETLMQALRAARLFSDAYEGVEARHER